MRVLIACEFSGVVRDAFAALGHDAWSCDLLPTERTGQHIQGDVLDILDREWDLMIAHPPCTHLAVSGARWLTRHWVKKGNGGYWHDPTEKIRLQAEAVDFVKRIWALPIRMKCLENPISRLSTLWKKPTQIIQPWQFGHGETKATCLWLDGIAPLTPTKIVSGREARVHMLPPSPDRWKERSKTYAGIAHAMAEQWGRRAAA